MAKRVLKRKRIAVLAADGFEKVELTIPVKALKLARISHQGLGSSGL
jgi:putative intracellular protease/amidase